MIRDRSDESRGTTKASSPDADAQTRLEAGARNASALSAFLVDRTVSVHEAVEEDRFFTTTGGETALTNRYDLERTVPNAKKSHFREIDRYWVNEPYAFVVLFHSDRENERKYYVVEPHLTPIEADLISFLTEKLRTAIKYTDDETIVAGDEATRADVIERETLELLSRYDLYTPSKETENRGSLSRLKGLKELFDRGATDTDADSEADTDADTDASTDTDVETATGVGADGPGRRLEGIAARPEPAVLAEDGDTLSAYQVEKLLYRLKRDFVGYERIDPVKHDINIEDISCDGYNSPVFVYHSEHEQVITNVSYGETELDDFVVKLAQRSGKGISKRSPQVDVTLPDGSRAQLTLGREVSDHGTNYTIRQFKDVPFTPIDLINWNTFSLDEMAYLWLCIENEKNLIFAGGTASGKTTSLNAVSLFIPSKSKIVSIEDTREVELPQRNWIASVTRPSFSADDAGDIDEFALLEAALRQRPEYIVMGEIRGEEGRTLFQVMSTGHTTLTTFHADSVGEVIKRFTTDPINVSKTMFSALDLVSVQTQTRVKGRKVRRNKSLTEINHYDAENDEINVQDVYQWQAEADEYLLMGDSNTLEEIKFDRGWSAEDVERELFERKVVLAYLVDRGLNTYTQVAATLQAYINDPETILTLIANDRLEKSLETLREMESVLIDIDPDKEDMVPRPDPTEETEAAAMWILEEARSDLLGKYRGRDVSGLASALTTDGDGDGDDATGFADAGLPDTDSTDTDLTDTALTDTADSADDETGAVADGGVDADDGSITGDESDFDGPTDAERSTTPDDRPGRSDDG